MKYNCPDCELKIDNCDGCPRIKLSQDNSYKGQDINWSKSDIKTYENNKKSDKKLLCFFRPIECIYDNITKCKNCPFGDRVNECGGGRGSIKVTNYFTKKQYYA